jgi:hypothetical protein
MQGGARYQVTAWLAAKMLAERPATPIVPRGKLTYVAAESGEAVDDALAGNDQGGLPNARFFRHLRLHRRREDEIGELSAARSLIQIKDAGRRGSQQI